jgi:hypothetical protein
MSESVPPQDETQSIDELLTEHPDSGVEEAPGTEFSARPLALDVPEANALASERRPTVLVLAGPVGTGKTSVYAAIYERLGRGPFGGWAFAGSRTIPGLEQRCHWWRTAADGHGSYMEHTRAEDLPWLHIRLRDTERRAPAHDLLLGDFDGEYFQQVLDGRVPAQELPFLRRADHVGLVIDGGRLAKPTERAAEKQLVKYLLGALTVKGALAAPEALSLIVTKTDLVEESSAQNRVEVDSALEEINAEANRLSGRPIPLLRLAVRSETARFPLGHGLEPLLEIISLRPALQLGNIPPRHEPSTPLGKFRS